MYKVKIGTINGGEWEIGTEKTEVAEFIYEQAYYFIYKFLYLDEKIIKKEYYYEHNHTNGL